MCTRASGRAVNPCWDPWPNFYDFQSYPDKSIEPPPEPLPLRYNLDDIWGSGPASGTTTTFANAPAAAPDDATRLNNLLTSVPYYAQLGRSAAFMSPDAPLGAKVYNLTTIIPADYDGTFVPSNSVRTVTPAPEIAPFAEDYIVLTDLAPGWSVVEPLIFLTDLQPGWTLISSSPLPEPPRQFMDRKSPFYFIDQVWTPPWSVQQGV